MNREQMIAWLTLEGWSGYLGGCAYGVLHVGLGKHCWHDDPTDETYYTDDQHWISKCDSHCSMDRIPWEHLQKIYEAISRQMP